MNSMPFEMTMLLWGCAFSLLLHQVELGVPKIQPFFLPTKMTIGQKIKIFCNLAEGTSPYSFQWKKDGHILSSSPSLTIQNQNDFSFLIINSLSQDNAGNFSCSVENSEGKDVFSAQLVVNVPPSISKVPQDVTVEEGNAAIFHCQATGYPVPNITWTKSLDGVKSAHADRLLVYDNGTMVIVNVRKLDEGLYVCAATNGIGQNLSQNVMLSVIGKVKRHAYHHW